MQTMRGKFGHRVAQKFAPTFGFNEKGGMDNKEFSRYLLDLTSRLYPDRADVPGQRVLVKVDSGPGRNCKELKALLRTEGIYLHMGVPNGTAAHQETDQKSNYGTFKPCLCQNRNQLFSYRQSKHHTDLALCERTKVADIKIDINDKTDEEEEITEQALHVRKAVAIKINSNDKNDEEEEEIIKINDDKEKEETQTGNCLIYPFAANQEEIESATPGLLRAIAEAPLNSIDLVQHAETSTARHSTVTIICNLDVERLNTKKWLNDAVVDFWMMW
jgi:hypothetical protein